MHQTIKIEDMTNQYKKKVDNYDEEEEDGGGGI